MIDADHAGWYQATTDDNRADHLRAAHWSYWRALQVILSAQGHAGISGPGISEETRPTGNSAHGNSAGDSGQGISGQAEREG